MKKEITKIAAIFLITVVVVLLGLNFMFFNQSGPKSKATGETISFVFDPSTVSQTSGDFVTSIKVKSSIDMFIRGYQFEITFDKSKVQFKSIQYKAGAVSAGLGDDDAKASTINQNGKIKVVGEIQSAAGQVISASQNTEIVAVTFTANSSQSSSITTGATDVKFSMIKADYSLFDVPSTGQVNFSVNGGTSGTTCPPETINTDNEANAVNTYCTALLGYSCASPNTWGFITCHSRAGSWGAFGPSCTAPYCSGCACLAPGNVTANLKLKLKFQGIIKKPTTDALSKFDVKVKLYNETTNQETAYQTAQFTSDVQGVWSGSVSFSVDTKTKYILFVKGPYHLQKKICDAAPTETAGGTYRCTKGNIALVSGDNNLDLSGIILLVGDLPEQDGTISAYDTSLVRNNLGKKTADAVAIADVNRDGVVDTQDYSGIIAALSVKNDEQ
jgi:hypothetical protein